MTDIFEIYRGYYLIPAGLLTYMAFSGAMFFQWWADECYNVPEEERAAVWWQFLLSLVAGATVFVMWPIAALIVVMLIGGGILVVAFLGLFMLWGRNLTLRPSHPSQPSA